VDEGSGDGGRDEAWRGDDALASRAPGGVGCDRTPAGERQGHSDAMSPAWRWFIVVAVAALFIFVAARVLSVW
jgi:hypothetical protein